MLFRLRTMFSAISNTEECSDYGECSAIVYRECSVRLTKSENFMPCVQGFSARFFTNADGSQDIMKK